MRNLVPKRDKYNRDFADAVYTKYLSLRYGIDSGYSRADPLITSVYKELLDWQLNEDYDALTQVSVNYMTWLPITFSRIQMASEGGAGCEESCYERAPVGIQLGYNYGNGQVANLVEVNTGGCITKINLNPTIYIQNSVAFTYHQTTPLSVWTINHNLGYVPNVWSTDSSGVNIEGTVTVIDINTITLTFSQPFSGWAYLS